MIKLQDRHLPQMDSSSVCRKSYVHLESPSSASFLLSDTLFSTPSSSSDSARNGDGDGSRSGVDDSVVGGETIDYRHCKPRVVHKGVQSSKLSMMPPSMQADYARRIQRRRRSLNAICPEACRMTQEYFRCRSRFDVLNETSDMEKPNVNKLRDSCLYHQQQHFSFSSLQQNEFLKKNHHDDEDDNDDSLMSLPELAGLISVQLETAIKTGAFSPFSSG